MELTGYGYVSNLRLGGCNSDAISRHRFLVATKAPEAQLRPERTTIEFTGIDRLRRDPPGRRNHPQRANTSTEALGGPQR